MNFWRPVVAGGLHLHCLLHTRARARTHTHTHTHTHTRTHTHTLTHTHTHTHTHKNVLQEIYYNHMCILSHCVFGHTVLRLNPTYGTCFGLCLLNTSRSDSLVSELALLLCTSAGPRFRITHHSGSRFPRTAWRLLNVRDVVIDHPTETRNINRKV